MPIAVSSIMFKTVCDYAGPHTLDRCDVSAAYRLVPVRSNGHRHVHHVCEKHLDLALGTAPLIHVEPLERTAHRVVQAA